MPARLFCPWDFLGKNTGVGCHALLQGIFPTQRLNLGLPHCRQILYCLSHQEVFSGYVSLNIYKIIYSLIWKNISFLLIIDHLFIFFGETVILNLLLLFSCSVTYDSLRSHRLQHARLLSPSPSPGACSNSCPRSQ